MVAIPSLPSHEISEKARTALRAFESLTRRKSSRRSVALRVGESNKATTIDVPADAFQLFLEILGQMANGNAVTLVPIHGELTTQQAADLLNVSRPHLVQLLEERKIPFRLVGAHRRVRAEDLFRFKEQNERERNVVLDELASEAQKHKLGY